MTALLALALAATVAPPTFSPAAGAYGSTQSVTVRSKTPGAAVYCTTDGSRPRRSTSLRVSSPVTVSSTETLRCLASTPAAESRIASAAYTISAGPDCVTAPLAGTVYYYCDCATGILGGAADSGCVAGNDANAGTSPSSPRRTLSDAINRFNGMGAGNTVALCRGGTWAGFDLDFNNGSCSAGSPCYFRDYAPPWGGTSRPRISSGGTILSNYNNNNGHYRVWGLDVRNPVGTSGANGVVIVYGTNPHDIDFCNLHVDGGWLGVYFEPTGRDPSGLQLRNSEIFNGCFSGFYGGAPGVNISGNYFLNNATASGCAGQQMHSLYIVSTCPSTGYYSSLACGSGVQISPPYDANTPTPFTVSNNHIATNSACLGTMFDLHGVWVNTQLVLENNLVETTSTAPGCYGGMISGGNTGAVVLGAVVRRNRFFAPGNALEVSCCQNCTVSDNITGGGGLVISDSCCSWTACNCPSGFMGGSGTIQNNTATGGFRVGSCGSGPYYIDDNAGWVSSGSCWSIANSGQVSRNGNNYCAAGTPAQTTLWVDPANATPGSRDFTPKAGSPLIGYGSSTNFSPTAIGSVTWSASDTGRARTPPIDAGAFIH